MADLQLIVTTNKETQVTYSAIDGSSIGSIQATVGANEINFTGDAGVEYFVVADDGYMPVGSDLKIEVIVAQAVEVIAGTPSLSWGIARGSSAPTTQVVLSLPSALAVGDYMVAVIWSRSEASVAGWQKVEQTGLNEYGGRIAIYTKKSTSSGAGSDIAVDLAGSGRVDLQVYGYTWDGGVEPYIDKFISTTNETEDATTDDLNIIGSQSCPVYSYATEFIYTSKPTDYYVSATLNSAPMDLSGWDLNSLQGDDNDGSRVASIASPAAYPTSSDITSIRQSNNVGGQNKVTSACFVVTCGKVS